MAIATWTAKANADPIHTPVPFARVAITKLANMVLSGSSARKIIGKQISATYGSTRAPLLRIRERATTENASNKLKASWSPYVRDVTESPYRMAVT